MRIDKFVIHRLAYDGDYKRAIDLLMELVDNQQEQIKDLQKQITELKENK